MATRHLLQGSPSLALCTRPEVTSHISLNREQKGPNPVWTLRWTTFDPQNIRQWVPNTTQKIDVTQVGHVYKLDVGQFVPIDGDSMEKIWLVKGVVNTYTTPPYAIIDLEKAAQSRIKFLIENVGNYIADSIDMEDELIRVTFERAMRHASEAKVCPPECSFR